MNKNIIFCTWTGRNAMSVNRIQALFSIFSNTGCPVAFVNDNNLPNWVVAGKSFHPAYDFLSETHKADYIRVYLMHHYGGGYTDIKHTTKNWVNFFEELNNSDRLCAGYTEIGPHGVAPVGGNLEEELTVNFASLIGLCAFIFRRRTPLTRDWIDYTHMLLDEKFYDLKENPSSHPQDRWGVTLPEGNISKYPLKWTELLGNIFHPLIYNYKDEVLHLDLAPSFINYR